MTDTRRVPVGLIEDDEGRRWVRSLRAGQAEYTTLEENRLDSSLQLRDRLATKTPT